MPIAKRKRRSPEPDGRARRRGTPAGDSAKPVLPAAGACAACGGAGVVTDSSATPYVVGTSGRLRRGSGPTPASRDRRAASAMAANAWGLSFWSL